jgi:hypothetical protein
MMQFSWRRPVAVVLGALAAFVLTIAPVRAAAPEVVYFAGVAFTGDAATSTQAFPHLSRVLDANGNAQVNASIRQQLQAHPSTLAVSFDQLGSIKDASRSVALALAIDRETTSVEQVGDAYKVRLEIAAQLLFFDFKEKQVLGGFPLVLDYVDVRGERPSDTDILAGFRGMVLGASAHALPAEFVAALGRASVPSAATRHLRVASITLADKAREYLATTAPSQDADVLRTQVAQEFGKYLAANQKLAILPYSSNKAIGGSMAARFVEGEAYQLKIPETDYEIALDVVGFKKVDQGHNNVNSMVIYGSFVDVTIREPLSNHVYFSQRIRQGATKEVPVTQTSVDDWAASYESLLLLFNNFTQAASNPASPWVKSGLPDSPDAKAQLSSLAELIKSCR